MQTTSSMTWRFLGRAALAGLFGLLAPILGFSQISITGPSCVAPNTSATFVIAGNWSSSTTMSWVVQGGSISSNSSGTPQPNCTASFTQNGYVTVTTSNPSGSATFYVSVSTPIAIDNLTPLSQEILYDGSPSISCPGVIGGSCSATLQYQWEYSYDQSAWVNVAGATGLTLSNTGGIVGPTYFRLKVTDPTNSDTAVSDVSTVTTYLPLSGGNIGPVTQDLNPGQTITPLGGEGASGGDCQGSFSYQWWSSADGVNYTEAATGSGYQPLSTPGLIYYKRLAICSSDGEQGWSNVVTVNIESPLAAGSVTPQEMTIAAGTSPGTLSSTTSTGGFCQRSGYVYQWEQSTNASQWVSEPGADSLSFNPGNLDYNTYYRLRTTCGTDTVDGPAIIVNVSAQMGAATPSSQWINYSTNAQTLSVGAVTAGGTGNYTYLWQASSDSMFDDPVSVGGDSLTYTPLALTQTTYYRMEVNSPVSIGYSGTMVVNVYPQVKAGVITPPGGTVVYSYPAPLLIDTGFSGGNGTYTYEWLSNASGSYQPVSAVLSGTSFQPPNLTSNTSFEVVVSSNGVSDTSAPVIFTLVPLVAAGTLSPALLTIPPGGSPGLLTCTKATCIGCTLPMNHSWQSSPDGSSWTTIGGDTGYSYNPGALSATTYYRFVVSMGTYTSYSDTAEIMVGAVNADLNYVRTRTIKRPGVTDIVTADGLTTPGDVQQTTAYFDGLGREVQTVAKQASPLLNDMVTLQTYDGFGREAEKYLPYTSPTNDGNYKTDPFGEQSSFNTAQFPTDQYFYGQVEFEASPLNRPQVAYAPGNSWVGSYRGVRVQYLVNTAADSVHIWNIAYAGGSIPTDGGIYAQGLLYKTITTDEQGNQTVEYKDEDGHVILKKVQFVSATGTAHVGWLCTYYVYDDKGLLRFVISPRAVELTNTAGTWTITKGVANELCFRYEYDYRGRMAIKKIPGAGEDWTIYDVRDLPVMTQDSNLRRQGQWLVTQYDTLNRPVETGLINYAATQTSMQQVVTSQTASGGGVVTFPADTTISGMNTTGDIRASHSITGENGFSTADGGTFIGEVVNGNWGSGASTSNNNTIALSPVPSGVTLQPLTITYYDDYSWVSGSGTALPSTFATAVAGSGNYFITSYNTSPSYAVQIAPLLVTRGQVTGTQTLVLGSNGRYLSTIHFYDDRARLVQILGINFTGGLDTVTTQYDFSGKPLRTLLGQAKVTNTAQYHQVLTKTNYDPNFRMTSVYKNIDRAISDQLVDSMQYNELGQLRAKYLGKDSATGQPLDSLVYDYNVRGWVTGINKAYVAGTAQHYFGMELGYDNPTSVAGTSYSIPAYNGNIAGTIWKSAGDQVDRKYDFTYDPANRLMKATYLDNHSGNGWNNSAMDYTVNGLSYDANGNILSMNQYGYKLGSPAGLIDQLRYAYEDSGSSNKLTRVIDGANDTASTLGDFHYKGAKADSDYRYDGNGNLTIDNNKSIDSIYYNYLNLPQQVHMKGKGNIFYTYDAAGNKLTKQTIDSAAGLATTTLYLDGFQYQRRTPLTNTTGGVDTLQFVGHEEGRARWAFQNLGNGDSAYSWQYDFYERDHLGNTRVVLTQEQETDQYPAATMEASDSALENLYYSNLDETRSTLPAGYPTDTTTNPNKYVAQVVSFSSVPAIGPGIVLKVMAGDHFSVRTSSWWRTGPPTPQQVPNVASDLVSALIAAMSRVPGEGATAAAMPNSPTLTPSMLDFLADTGKIAIDQTRPHAFLNWILFDNQFNYVAASSGCLQVGVAGPIDKMSVMNLPVNSSGFLYIYVNNASPNVPVFFDNLQVTHVRGPLLEEDHYYPFGLTIAGISDKAIKANYAENKYRWNKGSELQNKEFSDGSGLEMYETPLRSLDPQLGRWWQIDSKPDYAQSLYAAMGNNPILRNDVLGDTTIPYPARVNQPKFDPLALVGLGSNKSQEGQSPKSGSTATTNGTGSNKSTESGNSGTVKQTGEVEEAKPLAGSTNTDKFAVEHSIGTGVLGDKITASSYTGVVAGKEGSVITTDASTSNGKPEGGSITLGGVLTLGYSTDGSVSAGLGAGGYEGHVSVGFGVGLGQVGVGGSHTSENGAVSGGDLTIRAGAGTLVTALLSPLVLAF